MHVCDALVTVLRELEVRYLFGVSGANIEHVHDAVHRLGHDRLSSVLARREDGAAFMADARARVHRTLGVCCATSGGGMMNLVSGLAESYAESVPVLALIGQPPAALDGRGSFQDSSGIGRTVDAQRMLGSFTKKVTRVVDPAVFWEQLHDAIGTALTGRMGPTALLIPRDSYELEVGGIPADFPAHLDDFVRTEPVEQSAVADLFQRLTTAACPVLLLGHGVRRSSNPDAVREFAVRTGLPVATTMGARAEFPNDDPRFLGVVGAGGHPSAADFVSSRADLVVLVGTGLSAMTRAALPGWNPANAVAVNIDPADLFRSAAADTVVVGDAGAVFEQLNRLLTIDPFRLPTFRYSQTRFRPRLGPPLPGRPVPPDGLLQSEAVEILATRLPTDGHLLYDAGNCSVAAMHYASVPIGCTSTIALGMGGMGYTVGGAVGAQLGTPAGTRTMVFCGDAAFLMSGQEVHTAVEHRLPILFVVFNNGMHGMCVTRQQILFDSRIEATAYSAADLGTFARGLGGPDRLWVGRAGSVAELLAALADQQRNAHLTGVLELRLTREELPPFVTFLPADEPTMPVRRQLTPEGDRRVRARA